MTPDTSVYTDLQGFASLRAQAQKDPNAAIDQVAAQFESIFTQMMVKSMRDASEPLESDWAGSSQMKSYQQMFDQQLSLDLSGGGGLGLAKIIATQLGGGSSKAENTAEPVETRGKAETTAGAIADLSSYRKNAISTRTDVSSEWNSSLSVDEKASNAENINSLDKPGESHDQDWLPKTPKEFVEDLWGLAKTAANALGMSPGVILAQAALETGWGKHMIRNSDGSNSFNLFGIKGGNQWSGAEAQVSTLEYSNGIAERQKANFRSYDSLADAFKDYVSFLTESPRYEQALRAIDDEGFALGLQESGYATDPNYAEKILGILNRPEFQGANEILKNSDQVSL